MEVNDCTESGAVRNSAGQCCVDQVMIEKVLARQDGVITAAQARDAGLTHRVIEGRVNSGAWRRIARGLYVAVDRPFTDEARARCAVWSTGSGVLSGAGAAFWLGLTTYLVPVIEVTVPRTASGRSASGVRIRRRTLDPADVVELRGIRVTRLELTVLEASTVLGQQLVDRQLQRNATLPALRRAQDRNARRHGHRVAERYLLAAEGGARSEAERLAIRLLTADGLTGWEVNHPFGGYVIDIAFPALRLAIEIDGWAFHSDSTVFHRDRRRQNVLVRHWTVLRYTWHDLTHRPDEVIAEIRRFVTRVQ